MLDYKALSCLKAVLQFQSFEKAAQSLNLTQSAVSQAIKKLESSYGSPVVIRARPVVATPLGEQLLAHINKVSLLEDNLTLNWQQTMHSQPIHLAASNDVLATWFPEVVTEFSKISANKLHLQATDQALTREKLKTGEVIACLSDIGTPVPGGKSLFIGNMIYELVATPSFIEESLNNQITIQSLAQAPSLTFDKHDDLWSQYQKECLGVAQNSDNCHWYPSSHGFVQLVLGGTVCALVPRVQVKNELSTGKLVSLLPDRHLSVPMYWHWYELNSGVVDDLTKVILNITKIALN
ncbi:ArgP/LysG family DNA-binding transcriptional regulator [Marinomonas epiphytica]